jgi:hypothetical protein
MRRSSARSALIAAGVVAAEVAITTLSVCRDQAAGAIGSLLAIGVGAFALVALAILGHRFIGRRAAAAPEEPAEAEPEPEPWAWRRPWFAAALASMVTMGLIVALGVEVLLTQPARCA